MAYIQTAKDLYIQRMAMAQASSCENQAKFCPAVTELWLKMRKYGKVKVKVIPILSSQVVSLPLQTEILEFANFCAALDTLIGQDGLSPKPLKFHPSLHLIVLNNPRSLMLILF